MKFPEFPATFPEREAKFADFGQDLQKSGCENEKFPAKFPEAGNLKLPDVSQFLTPSLPAAVLTSIVFHSIFAGCSSRAGKMPEGKLMGSHV